MTDREKLVELLQDGRGSNPVWGWFPNNATMVQLADYLLSNGVTFAKETNAPTKWIPVTERLIDADALREAIEMIDWYSLDNGHIVNGAECDEKAFYKAVDIFAAVDNASTIEAKPIKHAHWIINGDWAECSNCHEDEKIAVLVHKDFCPACGAIMDEEVIKL